MELKTSVLNSKISVLNEILNKDVQVGTKPDHTGYEYQAKIKIDGPSKRHSLVGAFTFLNKDGDYLGFDRGFFELDGVRFSDPYYAEMEVFIPKGTTLVECEIDYQPDRVEKWQIFLFVSGVLLILILLSWLIKLWL